MSYGLKAFWLILIVLVVAAGVWVGVYRTDLLPGRSQPAPRSVSTLAPPSRVTCLGRVEPKDGVTSLSARSLSGQASIVGQLNVREGDHVKAGQIVAVLDSQAQMEAGVRDLEAAVVVAQNRLATVKTGAKKGDVAAQEAEIARLEASLANARTDADRYEQLFQKQATTISERDQRRTAVQTTTQMLNEAKARLQSLDEIRDSDVKLAEAQVQAAEATVARGRAELEAAVIRAPFSGQVLKIHARRGEEVGTRGILDLARTDQMYVIAEVVESDVARLRIGEDATVTGDAIREPWHGKVESIGQQVAKDDISQTDPVSLSDARVVEVKVRLDNSDAASRLIHGQVTTVIGP